MRKKRLTQQDIEDTRHLTLEWYIDLQQRMKGADRRKVFATAARIRNGTIDKRRNIDVAFWTQLAADLRMIEKQNISYYVKTPTGEMKGPYTTKGTANAALRAIYKNQNLLSSWKP